jgi:hypothetical protein
MLSTRRACDTGEGRGTQKYAATKPYQIPAEEGVTATIGHMRHATAQHSTARAATPHYATKACTQSPTHRTAWRINPVEPSAQSKRVCTTMSRIVRTPLPGLPIRMPQAWSYSISDDALLLSPSFSFNRMTLKPVLRLPSGSQRGIKKQDKP